MNDEKLKEIEERVSDMMFTLQNKFILNGLDSPFRIVVRMLVEQDERIKSLERMVVRRDPLD